MALPDDQNEILKGLTTQARKNEGHYSTLDKYYEGSQKLQHIGMAIPPELRGFQAVVHVPRMAVDEPVKRQNLRGFQRSGQSDVKVDDGLLEAWQYNNLDSQSFLVHKDARLYGRTFVSVSTNPDDSAHPHINVESPEGFAVDIDPRRRMRAALRVYKDEADRRQRATLYLPDMTRWLIRDGSDWVDEEDPDEHGLGRVPVVMFMNRARTRRWGGTSEMADVMDKTDTIGRIISNMQVGADSLAWPHRWAAGVSKDDFVDKNGKPLATFQAYISLIQATANKDAKFGNFAAADLGNFHAAVNELLSWCAAELGLPIRYMGQRSVNPASEGAIVADESRLITNVEVMNRFDGDSWSWVMGLHERFRTKEWPAGNEIRALWQNPATPTRAQIADAVSKLYAQNLISREGAWDEMGWDEGRKDRERAYLAAEAQSDPATAAAIAVMNGTAGAAG